MAVGAEQIAEEEGVTRTTLAAGRGVPGAAGLEGVGVDGDDPVAGVHQGIDDETRGAFEGEGERGGRAKARQTAEQLRQAVRRVLHAALPAHLTRDIEDAHGVRLTRPVEADEEIHCASPGDRETLRGERSCRSLTDRRSGLQVPLAQHPVAGLGLSSFDSGEQVSQWPSSGKRTWLSPNPSRSTFPRMRGLTGSAQEIRSRIAPRIDDRSPRTGLSSTISEARVA